jgi:(1->4)-alpha-D-glucan 1-alpha-D-glucosylmutase
MLASVLPMQQRIARLGMINSLAQVTAKIGSPGVPDFYQGTELWELSLVDPDNRRPVDFGRRRCALTDVDAALASDSAARAATLQTWLRDWTDGRIKMIVTVAGLRLRRDMPDVFLGGDYVPIPAELTVPAAAVAFARRAPERDQAVVFVAPRLFSRLVTPAQPLPIGGDCWKTSRLMLPPELADREFRDEVTGTQFRPTRSGDAAWLFIGEVLQTLPIAMLRAI